MPTCNNNYAGGANVTTNPGAARSAAARRRPIARRRRDRLHAGSELVVKRGALTYDVVTASHSPTISHLPAAARETLLFCIVPVDIAADVHDALREHFRGQSVEVVVEQRRAERRDTQDRRGDRSVPRGDRRRRIRDVDGRRVADRRAPAHAVDEVAALPPELAQHRARLEFVRRRVPSTLATEDVDTAHLVKRLQAGDSTRYPELYLRYFDRVYTYLRMSLRDPHEAEDLAQDVFAKVWESLSGYERRTMPFRFWLFRIARNRALDRIAERGRVDLKPPVALEREYEREQHARVGDEVLDFLTDRHLLDLVEQLPEGQRQVLALRHIVDLSTVQMAQVLGRSPAAVRQLECRALRSLRSRAAALRHNEPAYA